MMAVVEQSLFTGDTIALQFSEFDQKHPEIYAEIVRIAAHRFDMGSRHLSMKLVVEQIRDNPHFHRYPGEPVKINNNWTALYTRKLASVHPQLAAMFGTRRRKS